MPGDASGPCDSIFGGRVERGWSPPSWEFGSIPKLTVGGSEGATGRNSTKSRGVRTLYGQFPGSAWCRVR